MPLINELDGLIQTRFGEVTEEDVRTGRFGVSRIVGLAALHPLVLRPQSLEETLVIGRLAKEGWRTALYVIGVKLGREGQSTGKVTGPIYPADAYWPADLNASVIQAVAGRAIGERRAIGGSGAGLHWEARLVNASNTSCLDCHSGKALGDPLGVVLYTFGQTDR
jgi:hypothetical protein